MDERVMQFRVGVIVFATAIIAGLLVLVFTPVRSFLEEYQTIYIKFPSAPGVTPNTPIRKSGILIGRVTDVQLTDDGSAMITAAIQTKYTLRHNEVPRIGGGSLLGDAVVSFIPTGGTDTKPIVEGDVILGKVASDPFEVIASMEQRLDEVVVSFTHTSNQVGSLSAKLEHLVDENDEQVTAVISKASTAIDRISDAATSANSLLANQKMRDELEQGIAELPVAMKEATNTMHKAQAAISRFEVAMDGLNDNVEEIKNFTKPLGEKGPKILEKAELLMGNLNTTSNNLNRFTDQMVDVGVALQDREGTIGRLLYEDDIYENIDQVAKNVNRLSSQIEPILRDARVFSDKIARHPELLGVRGRLERQQRFEVEPVVTSHPNSYLVRQFGFQQSQHASHRLVQTALDHWCDRRARTNQWVRCPRLGGHVRMQEAALTPLQHGHASTIFLSS